MGFNKRIVNKEKLKKIYLELGYFGLDEFVSKQDSLSVDSNCREIVDIILSDSCITNKELKIKKIWQE